MGNNEKLDPPPPQDISDVFSSVDLSSRSSYDSARYKCAWIRAKVIRSSILYAGECPDTCITALFVALNYKEILSPKQYADSITRHEQKKNILSHITSVGNKQKQKEDRKHFVMSNIVSIVSSPSNKTDQNEVH